VSNDQRKMTLAVLCVYRANVISMGLSSLCTVESSENSWFQYSRSRGQQRNEAGFCADAGCGAEPCAFMSSEVSVSVETEIGVCLELRILMLCFGKKLSGDCWRSTVAVPKPAVVNAGASKPEATVNLTSEGERGALEAPNEIRLAAGTHVSWGAMRNRVAVLGAICLHIRAELAVTSEFAMKFSAAFDLITKEVVLEVPRSQQDAWMGSMQGRRL
jgi:hypothetical protein